MALYHCLLILLILHPITGNYSLTPCLYPTSPPPPPLTLNIALQIFSISARMGASATVLIYFVAPLSLSPFLQRRIIILLCALDFDCCIDFISIDLITSYRRKRKLVNARGVTFQHYSLLRVWRNFNMTYTVILQSL